MSQTTIKKAALELCAAIMEHASLCEGDSDNAPNVIRAGGRIQDLMRAYGDAVLRGSGWSNPLLGVTSTPLASEEDSQSVTSQGEHDGSSGRIWVSVVDQHALFVEDPAALIAHAAAKTGTEVNGVVEALLALCAADGWKPEVGLEGMIERDWRSTDACTG